MRYVIVLLSLVLVLGAGAAFALTDTFSDSPGLVIPDKSSSLGAPPGEAITTMDVVLPYYIDGIRVYMNLTTAWSSDLRIWVESPYETMIELLFIAEGGEPATNPAGWYPTDFTPREDMAQWIGEGASGTWTIICQDWSAGGGNSVLNEWRVEVTYDDAVPGEASTLSGIKALYR